MASEPILDHVVLLVSRSTLLELPERLKGHFVVSPGGEHAGGLTSNKLIVFEDGVYIELIAFHDDVDPEMRRGHRWGACEENTIIDWAYTLSREDAFAQVQQRVRDAGTGITYADAEQGGRTRPDGTVLEWSVAAAQGVRPGSLPFWCLDKTPRHLRVPYEDEPESTRHPSGIRGVSRLRLCERGTAVDKAYDAIHGRRAGLDGERSWRFHVPNDSMAARHTVSVAADDLKPEIRIVFLGGRDSPSSVELLPGLVAEVEIPSKSSTTSLHALSRSRGMPGLR